ncbi:MAG TPA: RagB/SusD family nutrient uptake outer membrane protein, partial [Gemmatimonadota bacterium]
AIAGVLGDAELELAAIAGRASTRVGLGDWSGAAADAALVPTGFVHRARTSAIELSQYNRIYWGNAKQPLRLHTVWSTFYEGYFAETQDPRTPWTTDPEFPTGRNGNPWLVQTKHAERGSPINLVTGREMRLIEAEALLRGGDAAGALAIVNALRAEAGVGPREAATLDEAWVALKRERGIELWLEGRRLWDLHRWIADGTPGAVEDMTGRSTCFPVGRTEVDANPNVDRR